MPLFACTKCNCIENTATSSFWNGNKLCSECQTGKWHGYFEKKSAKRFFIDSSGFLYSPEEVDYETMEWKYNRTRKMVGII